MANILFLVHRLPYPPNKGDKVRSFHLLKHLAAKHRVFLGTFVDDPDDQQYVDTVKGYCADSHFASLNPRSARIRSLNGLLAGEPLTLRYYRDAGLQDWVNRICQTREIDSIVIFCSAMAQYVEHIPRVPKLVDFVDVDSAKWSQYATSHKWPMSWLYRREGRLLLDFERETAASASRSFFVTDAEVALFNRLAPECAVRVDAVCNGVDSDFFAPDDAFTSPYAADEVPIVFTGAMDYHPNADAAQWFAREVMPLVTARTAKARFYVIGRSPGPEVLALQGEHVAVSGTVPDVRPYLQHAALVVAPLRIARGIQNKILEAMAMAKAVIASTECAGPIDATPGEELLAASSAESFASQIDALLSKPEQAREIGRQGRAAVVARYSWDAHLSRIDPYLPQTPRSC